MNDWEEIPFTMFELTENSVKSQPRNFCEFIAESSAKVSGNDMSHTIRKARISELEEVRVR